MNEGNLIIQSVKRGSTGEKIQIYQEAPFWQTSAILIASILLSHTINDTGHLFTLIIAYSIEFDIFLNHSFSFFSKNLDFFPEKYDSRLFADL